MFPTTFAQEVICEYSGRGQAVLDPFAGRASSIYAAATASRRAVGVEINPVGWVYSAAKLAPARKHNVLALLRRLDLASKSISSAAINSLPEFFHFAFGHRVLRMLVAARRCLDWRQSKVDQTLMALLLTYLHGKRGSALSNQLRDGKAMSPDYAVDWWLSKKMLPPDIDPLQFMTARVEWRYAKGIPEASKGRVYFGDSTRVLPRLVRRSRKGKVPRFDLLFTSPPYSGVTDYHYDQWLRLWLLGGSTQPSSQPGRHRSKFISREHYCDLLERVFNDCAALCKGNATVYVRTDRRDFTFDVTYAILRTVFPKHRVRVFSRPIDKPSQTALFGDSGAKPGDMDILLQRS